MSAPPPPRLSLLNEARLGVRGVFALLGFRPGWRAAFNVSRDGIARSFIGLVAALPAFWFMIEAVNFYAAENPDLSSAETFVTPGEAVVTWLRFWVLFPVVAWLVCLMMDLKDRFAAWLVVHNWTVFVLVHVQALFWALYMAGLADPASLGALLGVYQFARLLVHWRVAQGALGLPPGLAAAAAGVPLIADLLLLRLL